MKPYVISQDSRSGAWYAHHRDYPYIPVFASVGDKKKAQKVANERNKSIGK